MGGYARERQDGGGAGYLEASKRQGGGHRPDHLGLQAGGAE